MVINFLYTLGLYIHNFVFWNTDLQMRVADTFVFAPTYDLATCLAMFTNLSSTIIFITRVEMHFHTRYKAYSEAVIGGRWEDIKNTKDRMFRQLSAELMNLVRIQFIISTAVYLLCVVVLPQYGFSGRVMQIYPCLAAGYFILFILYAEIIFLYYFNDMAGAMLSSLVFCAVVFAGSILSSHLSTIWYRLGVVLGSFAGFTVAYFRIRWLERHLDEHIFCRGILFPVKRGKMPDSCVYKRDDKKKTQTKGENKMMTIIRILMVGTGIFVFWFLRFWAYTRQKLNDSMALIWAFVSIALVITGAVPAVSKHLSESLLIFMFIICLLLLFLLFKVSKAVSVLSMKNQELAMQVSLLNQENERILHKLGILTDEKKDSVRD